MDLNTRVKAPEGVIHTQMEDQVVLMHVADGKYYALNAVGSAVWRHIAAPSTVLNICGLVEQEFEVDSDTCRRDVLALLDQLNGIGLIEIVE